MNTGLRLFHISENPSITVFKPRPSPSFFEGINAAVVFAIHERLLHNYLLPRDCPRICFYSRPDTTPEDHGRYFGLAGAPFVIAVESEWLQSIDNTTVYCYEMPIGSFTLLDDCAGYYISYKEVAPLSVVPVSNLREEILSRGVELRYMPELRKLATEITSSTLNYSMIRMRNAK